MGGDYYGGRDVVSSTSAYSDASAQAVGKTSSMHSSLNPLRWKDENLQCDCQDPIVFALDVTGSMGDWTKIIYDKMPMFYGQIMMQKYLGDPALSFCAVGDVTCDDSPLQVSEFGQGKAIDQLISKMYLEGGGGGNQHESYDLAAHFYATRVDLINCEFPFFFITGDEGFWEREQGKDIEKVFGQGIKEQSIDSKEIWTKLMKVYNVFHIKKPFSDTRQNVTIKKQWVEALGQERVLDIVTPKACIDVMLGAIALTSGTRDLNGYIEDMKTRGQDAGRIVEVTAALKPYWEGIQNGKMILIKHKVSPLLVGTANTVTSELSENKITSEEMHEVQQLVEKLLIEELDEESLNYVNKLKSLSSSKADEVPKEFVCPITKRITYDPVMTSDGHTFERKAIECWFEKYDFSPVTHNKLDSKILLPNFALKQLIRDYVESSGI